MATAFWRTDKRTGQQCLVAKWRDDSAPRGWAYERRPNDRTKRQAEDYAREMEKKAERREKGLESDPVRTTFGELLDWWWERHGRRRRGESKHDFHGFLEKHLGALRPFVLTPATAGAFADSLDTLLADKAERNELAPQSLNHLRAGVFRIFECARDPKARLWAGENPIHWVRRYKVPKRRYETLDRNEVLPVLAAFSEPRPGAPWRWAAAVCLYTGARPGEAFGLWKADVDAHEWVATIRRSWTQPFPKDEEPRRVLIPPELRPYLVEAMRASPNHLVFPRLDGTPFTATTRYTLGAHLHRAVANAGLIEGYLHTCRRCKAKARKGEQHAPDAWTWRHDDATQRKCPTCGMKLWIAPIPRPVRFYDLRHTNATLLRKARVDLGSVQKSLGHSSPEITEGTYDHSELEDDREAIERALTFEESPKPARLPSPSAPEPLSAEGTPEGPSIVRTTGAPKPVTSPASSAQSAQTAIEGDLVITSGCDPVRPVSSPANGDLRPWGASGRWFKSSRPDHLTARHRKAFRGGGPSFFVRAVRFAVRFFETPYFQLSMYAHPTPTGVHQILESLPQEQLADLALQHRVGGPHPNDPHGGGPCLRVRRSASPRLLPDL